MTTNTIAKEKIKFPLLKDKVAKKLFTEKKGAITLFIFEKLYSQSCLIKSTE